MQFIKANPPQAAAQIAARLCSLLSSGQSVLWLVSGGSNIAIQQQVMDAVPDALSQRLAIMPVDERYGPYNHPHSNAAQMRKAGFDSKHAEWIDILEENLSVDKTTRLFNEILSRAIAVGDVVFATLGVGPDGHIAGILPRSPALGSSELAVYYQANDFMRITMCADAIAAHCSIAYVCAFGSKKHWALAHLASKTDNRDTVPADLLHDINDCTLFNDQLAKEE